MSNILKAILNIYNCPAYNAVKHYNIKNRANNMGDALEHFIKDSFANSYESDEAHALEAHSEVFAYLGNQNNPPDAILNNGDAIEIKKIESANSSLALNSSYPKSKIYRNSTMLTAECKNCDGGNWLKKDLIFAIGVVKNESVKQLCFVYGEDYAADRDIYERIRTQIKDG
ncbi:MAG: NgoPII family restriction endonuclease, partial [Clostridia bacterium]|nr:NgoPII family restriction endonuclease [Clostridia bacterium]